MKEIIVRGLVEINTKDMAKSEYAPFVEIEIKSSTNSFFGSLDDYLEQEIMRAC